MSLLDRIFPTEYVWETRMDLPDGKHEHVRVVAQNANELASKAFIAGVKFQSEHPDLRIKRWRQS